MGTIDANTKLEEQMCPRRLEGADIRNPGPDHWELGRWDNGVWPHPFELPRTCSFCGAAHPEDVLRLMREKHWYPEATDKRYKRYLKPPEHSVSPVPPVKIYAQHWSSDQIEQFNTIIRMEPTSL